MSIFKKILFLTILGTTLIIVSCNKTTEADNEPTQTPEITETTDFYAFFTEFQADLKATNGNGLQKYIEESYQKSLDNDDIERFVYIVNNYQNVICDLTAENNYSTTQNTEYHSTITSNIMQFDACPETKEKFNVNSVYMLSIQEDGAEGFNA